MDTKQLFSTLPYDLGVTCTDKKVFLYSNLIGFPHRSLHISTSIDGLHFQPLKKRPSLRNNQDQEENTYRAKSFRISPFQKKYFLTYTIETTDQKSLQLATSKDLITWTNAAPLTCTTEAGMLIPQYTYQNQQALLFGENDIHLALSSDMKTWIEQKTILSPRHNYFDRHPLEVGTIFLTEDGILVLYYVKEHFREGIFYSVGAALFDANDPSRLLWRRSTPICTQQLETENGELYPMGIIHFKEKLLLYFGVKGKYVFVVHYGNFNDIFDDLPGKTKPRLEKYQQNPIIAPVLHHAWQATATFNPAAVQDEDKVHFIYRAMGPENTSVLGHAISSNGTDIEYRSEEPIYLPREDFESPGGSPKRWFMSGGGYGGCEDPRITKLDEDNKFYLTYIAYDGANPPRVALSSISVADFRERNWAKWATPKLISPPNMVNKNAVLFPEKIGGKYILMHRVFPNILIDVLDDLEFNNGTFLQGKYKIRPSENGWDSRKVGAGPPPIKTKDGWLLIYHAVDDKNDSQYKIGAMLLDLHEPWKVLYRTLHPILEPTEWYENHGFKAGVAYPCGAVVKNNILYVYYGGADTYTCVASQNLDEFLAGLKEHHPVLKKIPIQEKRVLHHYA